MTAWCACKSKETATPPPKITWLSIDSFQPDVMDVGVERTFSPQNFSVFSWDDLRLWATKSKDVGLIIRAISFQDFQPMWSWSTNVTDRRTDGQTDDMRSQDRALHYSASRGKNSTFYHTALVFRFGFSMQVAKTPIYHAVCRFPLFVALCDHVTPCFLDPGSRSDQPRYHTTTPWTPPLPRRAARLIALARSLWRDNRKVPLQPSVNILIFNSPILVEHNK